MTDQERVIRTCSLRANEMEGTLGDFHRILVDLENEVKQHAAEKAAYDAWVVAVEKALTEREQTVAQELEQHKQRTTALADELQGLKSQEEVAKAAHEEALGTLRRDLAQVQRERESERTFLEHQLKADKAKNAEHDRLVAQLTNQLKDAEATAQGSQRAMEAAQHDLAAAREAANEARDALANEQRIRSESDRRANRLEKDLDSSMHSMSDAVAKGKDELSSYKAEISTSVQTLAQSVGRARDPSTPPGGGKKKKKKEEAPDPMVVMTDAAGLLDSLLETTKKQTARVTESEEQLQQALTQMSKQQRTTQFLYPVIVVLAAVIMYFLVSKR